MKQTPAQTQTRHHKQLSHFADEQLAALSTRDICDSTVHLILAVAFFTGAAIGIAQQLRQPKKVYLASLCSLLQKRFGLEAHNASGMIESNARLYKRYVLIEKIYNSGLQAALAEQYIEGNDTLKVLLTEYANLNMSGLNIEGIKEPSVVPPAVKAMEEIAPVVPMPGASPGHPGRTFFLILLIVLITTGAFLLVYNDRLANTFPALQTTLAALMENLMKHVIEPARQWLADFIDTLINTARSLIQR